MRSLEGKVVLVSGGSRGAGRGIALACGEAGATVYIAARTPAVEDTAAEVTARGGTGIPVRTDLSIEADVAALFSRIDHERGRLDVLANAAWTPDIMAVWSTPFWELSPELWTQTLGTVSVCWWTTVHAVRMMRNAKHGLIAHVTDNYWVADDFIGRGSQ